VIHFLESTDEPDSSTSIRNAARGGRSISRFVAPPVAEYIRKMRLYRPGQEPANPQLPATVRKQPPEQSPKTVPQPTSARGLRLVSMRGENR